MVVMTGRELKILRLLHGLNTQFETALMLGVTERTVNNYETATKVSKSIIQKYQRAGFKIGLFYEFKEKFTRLHFGNNSH